jgi:hypothetical protein
VSGEQSAELPPKPAARTPVEAARKGIAFYAQVQAEDGHWPDDYGGPMFLLPGSFEEVAVSAVAVSGSRRRVWRGVAGLVISCYITGTALHWAQKAEMIRYLRNLQAPDGGWGLYGDISARVPVAAHSQLRRRRRRCECVSMTGTLKTSRRCSALP